MYITGIVALVLLVLSVPIGIALSASSAAFILFDPLLEPSVIFRQFFSFIARYSLMAIPLFIFAGFLMERTGLVGQLFSFADSLVGWMPGGFGVATVLACVLFGAISGSSVAMAAAMSVIAIPEMLKRGYPPWLAAGLVATAGGIAMLIPPSIILLIYGIVTETSVARLFFAGVIPGLMLAFGNIITVMGIAWYLKLPRGTFDRRRIWPETMKALPALGMPVVILGGLYGGLFTPTEAAAAACGYALLYGLIVGRGEFVKQLLPVAARSLNLTAVILFLVGSVGVFQFLAANLYWPQKITQTIVEWGLTPLGFMFAFMGVLLILGCRRDGAADGTGGVPGRHGAQDRPGPARHHHNAQRRDWRGHAPGRPESLRGERHLEDPPDPGSEGHHPVLHRRPHRADPVYVISGTVDLAAGSAHQGRL
jgi:C4-dicarboxylate transporter DctM subunit